MAGEDEKGRETAGQAKAGARLRRGSTGATC